MWLGLGSTQFPQILDFCIKRVHFEAHIYRNSNDERILRLIYKKSYYKIKEEHILRLIYSKIKEEQIWGLFTKEEIKSRFWGPFTKMVEEQILRLIFHQLRRRLSVTIIRAQHSCLLRRHSHFQPSLVLGKQPKHVYKVQCMPYLEAMAKKVVKICSSTIFVNEPQICSSLIL